VTLIYLSLAWLLGTVAGRCLELPLYLAAAGLLPLLILPLRHWRPILSTRAVILSTVILTVFIAAAAYYPLRQPEDATISGYNDTTEAVISGQIDDQPEYRGDYLRFRLEASQITHDGILQEISGAALVYAPAYGDYRYGDRLTLKGELCLPPQFDGFDYRGYLAEQGIYSIIYYPDIKTVSRGHGSPVLGLVYGLRQGMADNLARALPEPAASLAQGIVLGMRGAIPDPVRDAFAVTGTAHLLAISGLHLSIVAVIFLGLSLRFFGRRRYFYVWLALALVWLYALFTGLHPPVVRAAIMVSLFLTAELLGRQRSVLTALCFTAAVMVVIDPDVLWSVSFQMSFAAMGGLIFITPLLQEWWRRLTLATLGDAGNTASAALFLGDLLSVSLGAMLAIWPLTAHYFGIISLVGPLATLLALPALPAIIVLGAFTAVLGFLAPPLAQALAWLTWPFLAYLLGLVNAFAGTSFAAITLTQGTGLLIGVYYPLLAAVLWWIRRGGGAVFNPALDIRPPSPYRDGAAFLYRRAAPGLLLVALLLLAAFGLRPDGRLHVSFLDVGQGNAILVQTPDGHDILIDGGPSSPALCLALGEQMPFWDRGLDMVVITHPDADHITGLSAVLERFRVGRVLYAPIAGESATCEALWRQLEKSGIPATPARAGQQIGLGGGAVLSVNNPPSPPLRGTASDGDNNGAVITLTIGEVGFLLSADIYWDGEYALLKRRAVAPATVLKVAHHGAATSTTPEFLATADPTVAVISVGTDNRYGHPDAAVMSRLAAAGIVSYRTDLHGNIEFSSDGETLRVRTER